MSGKAQGPKNPYIDMFAELAPAERNTWLQHLGTENDPNEQIQLQVAALQHFQTTDRLALERPSLTQTSRHTTASTPTHQQPVTSDADPRKDTDRLG